MSPIAKVVDITEKIKGHSTYLTTDIHGCYDELIELLSLVKFDVKDDVLIVVGDFVDRGPDSVKVLNFVMHEVRNFYAVRGNHDHRLWRYLIGNDIKVTKGLQRTIDQLNQSNLNKEELKNWLGALPYILQFGDNVAVHAGLDPTKRIDEQSERDCIYMRYFGGDDYFDNVKGEYWYKHFDTTSMYDKYNIFFGHEVHLGPHKVRENVWAMDGGCVFGGELRLYDVLMDRVLKVQAKQTYAGEAHFDPNQHLERSKAHFRENVTNK